MQVVGAFAEFERAMIRGRTGAGLAAVRAEGRIGRRRSAAQVTRLYKVSEATVSRILAAARRSDETT